MKLLILCNLGLSVATGLEVAAIGLGAGVPGMIGTTMMGAGKSVLDKALLTKKKLYETCSIRECEAPWICYSGRCQECRQDDRVLGLVCEPSLQCMKIANAPLNLYLGCYNAAKYVDCGGHAAETCEGCAAGNGSAFCNGDCHWTNDDACRAKATTAAPLLPNDGNKVKCDDYNENPAKCAEETKDCYWWTSDVLAIKPKCKDLKAWRDSLETRRRKEINKIRGSKMDPDGAIENAEKAICNKHSSLFKSGEAKCAAERGAACVWDARWLRNKCIPRGSTLEPTCENDNVAAPPGGCRCVAWREKGILNKRSMETVCAEGDICNRNSKDESSLCLADKCLDNHCKNSTSCNQLTGKCTCVEPWRGANCDQEPDCEGKEGASYPGCRCVVKKSGSWLRWSKAKTLVEVCAESFICNEKSKDQASLCHGVAIYGKASVGETLTANTSTITIPEGAKFKYQWYRSDTELPISKSPEDSTYKLGRKDIGTKIKVKVTYESSTGQTERTSAATAMVADIYLASGAATIPNNQLNAGSAINAKGAQQSSDSDVKVHTHGAETRSKFQETVRMALYNDMQKNTAQQTATNNGVDNNNNDRNDQSQLTVDGASLVAPENSQDPSGVNDAASPVVPATSAQAPAQQTAQQTASLVAPVAQVNPTPATPAQAQANPASVQPPSVASGSVAQPKATPAKAPAASVPANPASVQLPDNSQDSSSQGSVTAPSDQVQDNLSPV